jgi:hypothetical protein
VETKESSTGQYNRKVQKNANSCCIKLNIVVGKHIKSGTFNESAEKILRIG